MSASSANDPPRIAPLTPEQIARVADEKGQKLVQHLVTLIAPSAARDMRPDLVQFGQLGLCAAARKYNEKVHDTRFLSFAATFIARAILRGLRGEKREMMGRAMLSAKLDAATLGARFLADETDRFSVIYDPKETNRHRLQTLSDQLVACMYIGLGMAPPDPEHALKEAVSRAIAFDVLPGVKAGWSDVQREIYEVVYEGGDTLTSIAEAHGVPLIRVRRMHKKMLNETKAALHERGIDENPELGPGEDDEEGWP